MSERKTDPTRKEIIRLNQEFILFPPGDTTTLYLNQFGLRQVRRVAIPTRAVFLELPYSDPESIQVPIDIVAVYNPEEDRRRCLAPGDDKYVIKDADYEAEARRAKILSLNHKKIGERYSLDLSFQLGTRYDPKWRNSGIFEQWRRLGLLQEGNYHNDLRGFLKPELLSLLHLLKVIVNTPYGRVQASPPEVVDVTLIWDSFYPIDRGPLAPVSVPGVGDFNEGLYLHFAKARSQWPQLRGMFTLGRY